MTGSEKGKLGPVMAHTPPGGEVSPSTAVPPAAAEFGAPSCPAVQGGHDDLINYRPGTDVRHHLADAVLAEHLARWVA